MKTSECFRNGVCFSLQALPGNRQTLVAMVIRVSIRRPVALFTSFYTAIAHDDDDDDEEQI